jgi:hypothetical protein
MDSAARIFEARLCENTAAWLLQMKLRRRILVAVDTSDSCRAERKQIEGFLNTLVELMQVNDSCSLWTLGQEEKAYECKMKSDGSLGRRQISQEMIRSLRTIRTGTWLRKTLQAMTQADREITSPCEQSFLLVVSDGEIFDVEAIDFEALGETPPGFVRVGDRFSSQFDVFRQHSVMVQPTYSSLKQFLAHRPLWITIKEGWQGKLIRRFSLEGELLSQEDGPFCMEGERDSIGLSFVAEQLPRLAYTTALTRESLHDNVWQDLAIACEALPANGYENYRRVLRSLELIVCVEGAEIDWDNERLTSLAFADAAEEIKFVCPVNIKHEIIFPIKRMLYCNQCDALLLSKKGIERERLPHRGVVRFAIVNHELGEATVCSQETGDHAYQVIKNAMNEPLYLLLNLDKH